MTSDASEKSDTSPCIRICQLDEQHVCIGCGRPLEVIAAWRHWSVQERIQWMNDNPHTTHETSDEQH